MAFQLLPAQRHATRPAQKRTRTKRPDSATPHISRVKIHGSGETTDQLYAPCVWPHQVVQILQSVAIWLYHAIVDSKVATTLKVEKRTFGNFYTISQSSGTASCQLIFTGPPCYRRLELSHHVLDVRKSRRRAAESSCSSCGASTHDRCCTSMGS